MKTIICGEPGRLALADTPEPPAPGPGQALVRVRRCGVCGTDLHAFRGRQPFFEYPRILGHELGVEVEALGAQALRPGAPNSQRPSPAAGAVQVGDRCAVEPYLFCGACSACHRGFTNCCENLRLLGVHIDGGMRERLIVPVDKLHRSAALSLDQLALVETLAIGCHASGRAKVREGETVLVVGAGPIGLSVLAFAALAGARPVLIELDERRRSHAVESLGLDLSLGQSGDPVTDLRQMLGGNLPTAVFDATGNADAMEAAFGYVAHGGRLILVGFQPRDLTFANPEFHRREMTLLATRNARPEDLRQSVALMEQGRVDPAAWITHRAGLDDAADRFAAWTDPDTGVLKAMLEI